MVKHGFSKELNKDYALILKAWPYEEELYTRLALEAKKSRGKSLIEFGCGSGEATIYFYKHCPKLKIYATDIDPNVIRNAKKNIKSKNVLFEVADVFKFKPDKRYDIVSSSHVIHNFEREKQEKMIKTMYNSLNDGGTFITMEKILPDDRVERERLWKRQLARFKIYDEYNRPDIKKAMLKHEAADKSANSILIKTPFIKMLEKIGFHDVKIVFRRDRDMVLTARK